MTRRTSQIKHLMRSGRAMMEYQRTGRLPSGIKPQSPLISYLEGISPRERVEIKNVRLSSKLGYNSGAEFANAAQMLTYLKPSNWMMSTWPAESCRLKSFNARITDELFNQVQGVE